MRVEVLRIDRGKELSEEIKRALKELDLYSSWILGGVGAVESTELGVYAWEKGKYERFKVEEPAELISMQGNVSEEGILHMHCTIGTKERVFSGHLFNAKVHIFAEIGFIKLDKKLRRTREIREGLKALDVEG